jgi:hypothetical protein
MKILDRIALNRLISILTSFILSLAKILSKTQVDNISPITPKPPKVPLRKRIPLLKNLIK